MLASIASRLGYVNECNYKHLRILEWLRLMRAFTDMLCAVFYFSCAAGWRV
jgi:hypothetical protein